MCLLSQTVQSASRKYVVTSWSYSSSCVRLCTSCWYISFLKVFFFFYFSEEFWELALVPTQLLQVNWTHRYLVGVLLSDQSDIFYSLFCRAEKQTWVNGNVQSRSSTDKTQMRSETKQIQTREQRRIALLLLYFEKYKNALMSEWDCIHVNTNV